MTTLIEPEAVRDFLNGQLRQLPDIARLPGHNQNFLLTTGDQRMILKLSSTEDNDESDSLLRLEDDIIAHLSGKQLELALPARIDLLDSDNAPGILVHQNQQYRGRLLHYIDGPTWAEQPDASQDRLQHLGSTLAGINMALSDLELEAARRTHIWDMNRGDQHRDCCRHFQTVQDRRVIEWGYQYFTAVALPLLPGLPHSIIHGDANEENIIVDGDRVTGLIDFGDALYNPAVSDLAIAVTYVMMAETEPFEAAAAVIAGYHQTRQLSADELEAIYPLIIGRLCMSLSIAARRMVDTPEHPSWYTSYEPALALIHVLAAIAPADAMRRLFADIEDASTPTTELDRGEPIDVLVDQRRRMINPNLSTAYERPLHMVRGHRQFLFERHGQPFLDMVNNVCHVGHCHPHVVAAAQKQIGLLNTNTRYLYDGLTEYASRLLATLPDEFTRCYFVNSGSEANELALRLAMHHTGRRDFMVVDGAYHGNTANLIAISPYKFLGKGGEGSARDWVHVVPLADGYRGLHKGQGSDAGQAYAEDFAAVLSQSERPVAGFITESLLSCGGSVIPAAGYLKSTFEQIRAAGGVCIADEVQVGFGRVGSHFWAFQSQDAIPDIVVLGKPIGNGHPMAAVITTEAIAASFHTGMEYFSTFGGNPVSCAIGMAVMDVIEDEQLQAHAASAGRLMLEGFSTLKQKHPIIGDVRGLGLFAGIELVRDRETLEPASEETELLVNRMRERNVLLVTDGPHGNVIKIKPPMVVTDDDINMLVRLLDDELSQPPFCHVGAAR